MEVKELKVGDSIRINFGQRQDKGIIVLVDQDKYGPFAKVQMEEGDIEYLSDDSTELGIGWRCSQ